MSVPRAFPVSHLAVFQLRRSVNLTAVDQLLRGHWFVTCVRSAGPGREGLLRPLGPVARRLLLMIAQPLLNLGPDAVHLRLEVGQRGTRGQ